MQNHTYKWYEFPFILAIVEVEQTVASVSVGGNLCVLPYKVFDVRAKQDYLTC